MRRTESAARQAIAKLDAPQPEQIGSDLPHDQIMDVARAFARILLTEAGEMDRPEPFTDTERHAHRVNEHPYYERTRRHDPAVDGDDLVERDFALSDLAQAVNEDRHFSGEPERFSNALDPAAILGHLVAAVRERRGE